MDDSTLVCQPSRSDLEAIKASLLSEYSAEDVQAMLNTASFHKDSAGVVVTYANNLVDKFRFITVLVHESEALGSNP